MRFLALERFRDCTWRSVLVGSRKDRWASRGDWPMRVFTYCSAGVEESFTLTATLLDLSRVPAAELAEFYQERREIETACDEVETQLLGRAQTRCYAARASDLVQRDLRSLMLAYHAAQSIIRRVAGMTGKSPD